MIDISIVIPCFNSREFIEEAVISACSQKIENFEVLVIDNASTDGTRQKLQEMNCDYDFKLILNEENIGAIGNFNKGIELASGTYIKFLESDDILEADCLKTMRSFLSNSVQFVSGAKFLIDEHSTIIGCHDVDTRLVQGSDILKDYRRTGNIIGTPSDCLISKELLLKVGGFSKRYDSYLNDVDVWLKICHENALVQFISTRVCRVRRHSGQIGVTGGNSLEDVKVAFSMLREPYFKQQRSQMEIHFAAAYFYRALRELVKGRPDKVMGTLKIIISQMGANVFLMVLYMPIYVRLLLKSKKKK